MSQLLDIEEDNTVSYLDDNEIAMCDLVMPNLCASDAELAIKIREAFDSGDEVYISVIDAMEMSAIKGFKVKK